MKTVVVIPTYNESSNITLLLQALLKLKIPNSHFLVVDDNSPDGTSQRVLALQKKHKQVHLLLRTKERGRGSAGIAGYKQALAMGADVVCEMDADFSHDPKYLPSLLQGIAHADVVLGSRAVEGGKDDDRPFRRQLLTKCANFYIRFFLGLQVKDCNSGYRCFRRKVLQSLDIDHMLANGPDLVQEVLYKSHLKGFHITEVPISFVERKHGISKLGYKHLYKGYFMVLRLRLLKLFWRL